MATWAYLSKFEGVYTSPEFSISLDGDGATTVVLWSADTPTGTSFGLQTNVSFDAGVNWIGWEDAINGGTIPSAYSNVGLQYFKIKYRGLFKTTSVGITPTLREVNFYFNPIIEFDNKGDVNLKPEIWIEKVGNGDFSIINTSKGNEEFKFTGLIDGETVYVNCEREQIETTLAVTYRYSNFNDNYLDFPMGVNVLKILGNARFHFRHQYKLIQG